MAVWKKKRTSAIDKTPGFAFVKNKSAMYFNKAAKVIIGDSYVIIHYDDNNPKAGKIDFQLSDSSHDNMECFMLSKGQDVMQRIF